MIKALVLDFDGLILDTETPFRESWQEIYAEHGLTVPPEAWAGLLGSSSDPPEAYELLEEHLARSVDRKEIHARRLARELELLETEPVMPGVRELIEEAKSLGLRLAIASSSERDWVVGHLTRLGLLEFFDAIVCSDDVERTKPAPDLYEKALEALGVRPEEAIAFEDSHHGVAAAKAAGIFTVAVPNEVTRHLGNPNADLIVDSIDQMPLSRYIAAASADR